MYAVANGSLRNRNVCLIIVQTWLVGVVYYGGSEPVHTDRWWCSLTRYSLLYAFVPPERPRIRHHTIGRSAPPSGAFSSHHHHDIGLRNQVDWESAKLVPGWLSGVDRRSRRTDIFWPDHFRGSHYWMSSDTRSGNWGHSAK